jgi:predicted nucleotidyltransferase component of viral defense system
MMARNHFTRIADVDDVDAKTVERDYVLTHVLAAICQQPGSRSMVFKGGTALRLCYFEDYRYSADLDFSLTGSMTTGQALELVRAALLALTDGLGFAELSLSEDGKYIVQRLQARDLFDLFDLYELFDGQALVAEHIWPSFERKAKHKSIDPARFADAFEKRMPQWKIRWQGEMDEHVPGDPTPFETIERVVRRALRAQLQSV